MASTKRKTTTERGLGWKHQQAVAALFRRHQDGSPCDWCGKPMYTEDRKNWDFDPDKPGTGHLQGDHGGMTRKAAIRAGVQIPLPDRLLHRVCNQQRSDGVNDHLAVVNRGKVAEATTTERLVMPWP